MKKFLVLLLVICAPLTSFALKVPSLYQVDMSVSSQTEEAREQAIQEGFAQVLFRVSGDPNITSNPLIKTNLKRADYYVQEYSYSQPSTTATQYQIQIRYDASDIKRLLKKAGQQYWGENRPLILVWLSFTDQDNSTQIVDSESHNDTYENLTQLGRKVGLPLIFPMMDMEDLNHVSLDSIQNKSFSSLKEAGKRYAPDGLLLGNIHASGKGYDSEWELVVGQQHWKWNLNNATMDTLYSGVIDQISKALAKRYGLNDTQAKPLLLKLNIKNVMKGTDVEQVIEYVKQIASVEQVDLAQVSSNAVDLTILVKGDINTFQQNALIADKLVLKSEEITENKLFYEWAH